jgi:4a-hydroxytetrahydrobiopterin dehydratase
MSELADRKFQPFKKSDQPLTGAEIERLLPSLPGWQILKQDGIPRLNKRYQFKDFKEALYFANQVGALAESENHHPEILVSWGKAEVSWWTFDVKGLHENDFILAARTDLIYGSIS